MCQISFKERVKNAINDNASVFRETFLEYDYLLCAQSFENYTHIITATKGNYLHLTGVHTHMSPESFYSKAADGKIVDTDFDFNKVGVSQNSVKGSVREKIKVLPSLHNFFKQELQATEGFLENKLAGTFSSADTGGILTIGFVPNGNPMSLLKGSHLKGSNIHDVDLVFRRTKKSESKLFDELIYGDDNQILNYLPYIDKMIVESLIPNKSDDSKQEP